MCDRRRIYHLALRDEWRDAVDSGTPYRRSTLGKSLTDEGYIHCSFPTQVQTIADLVYRGRPDVVLLTIDPLLVHAEVRVENLDGADERYPHIYGALPVDAVVRADDVPLDARGRLMARQLIEGA